MGVYIKDMKMPDTCRNCRFSYPVGNFRRLLLHCGIEAVVPMDYKQRHIECPLVEAKAPHGRLIDVDALTKDMESENGCSHGFTRWLVKRVVEDAPTSDVAPVVHGKWIVVQTFKDCVYANCNNCDVMQIFYHNKPLTKFCPDCGAKMDL